MGAVTAKNLALFNLRKKNGWNQIDVCSEAEIALETYKRIERGESRGTVGVWSKLQKLYNIPDEEMWKIIKQSM